MHDLGGRQGFGRVDRPANEPVFHARWEAAVFAIMQATAGAGAFLNVDRFRHAIERMEPRAYLTHGYYGRWLGGLETLLIEAGLLTREELAAALQAKGFPAEHGRAARPEAQPDPPGPPPSAAGTRRELERPAKFALENRVRTLAHGRHGHTRLPAYARNRAGRIVARHGGWVFPDTNAHGLGEQPQHLYTVGFRAQELFGPEADAAVEIHLDLFEPYLLEDNT